MPQVKIGQLLSEVQLGHAYSNPVPRKEMWFFFLATGFEMDML